MNGSHARVAKLADARDLKSRAPKGACRFNSGPGHHFPADPSLRSGFRRAAQTPRNRLNLKSRAPKGACRFNSGPGHQIQLLSAGEGYFKPCHLKPEIIVII